MDQTVHIFFIKMFGLTLVLKVFVTCCQVSIFIEYNSLLYSIVINEKLVYKLLKTTSGEKCYFFLEKFTLEFLAPVLVFHVTDFLMIAF